MISGTTMCIKGNIPHVIDARGALLKFTGYDFVEIGRLPRSNVLPYNLESNDSDKWIHPNGFIVTDDGTFLVLVNNLLGNNAAGILENFPSGIWEFSEQNGFVHKYSITYATDSTLTDYGQNKLSAVGALANMNRYSTSAGRDGQYVAGVTYYTNASSTQTGVFFDNSIDTQQKYGYFVTSWINALQLKDTWNKICVKFKELVDGDEIILKYRIKEEDPIYIDITWNDTTSFHTTTDVDGYEGYEVEILQGVGSGKCFHVTTISGSSPWLVNLDETLSGATGTAKARLQRWKKIALIDRANIQSEKFTIPNCHSERIQIKCCMQFTGPGELHELIINNKGHTNLE